MELHWLYNYTVHIATCVLQSEIITGSEEEPKLTSSHDTKAILKHVSV